MAEIMAKAAEKTPYVVVAFQECERMNILSNEMRRSLKELSLGLKVTPRRPAGTQGRHSRGGHHKRTPRLSGPTRSPGPGPLAWSSSSGFPGSRAAGRPGRGRTPRLGIELLSRTPSMAGVGEARLGAGWGRVPVSGTAWAPSAPSMGLSGGTDHHDRHGRPVHGAVLRHRARPVGGPGLPLHDGPGGLVRRPAAPYQGEDGLSGPLSRPPAPGPGRWL